MPKHLSSELLFCARLLINEGMGVGVGAGGVVFIYTYSKKINMLTVRGEHYQIPLIRLY